MIRKVLLKIHRRYFLSGKIRIDQFCLFYAMAEQTALEIFQIFLLRIIILPSAQGSILLSKHLTFCHPRRFYSFLTSSFTFFYCDPIY